MTQDPLSGTSPDQIPASHRDLAECPPVAALTTITSSGYPQTTVVWCDFDGRCLRINTMRGFAKERNMRRDRRVTLLCYDPRQPLRYLEVRGMVAAMTAAGAAEHLDCLASKYAGKPVRFFGDAIPASFAETETPVLCRIRPAHVVALDATGQTSSYCQGGTHVPVRANPRVSLLVVDPADTSRFIQIRGDAELVTSGAHEQLDALARRYTGQPAYYGYLYPEVRRLRETRVVCRIQPRRITLDAIHKADH